MKSLYPLMQREWLQHRFGWTLLMLVPIALAVLLTSFGQIDIDADSVERAGQALPMMLAMISIVGGTALLFVIMVFTSWIIVAGLARRDHGDRSVEFWMSMPVGHAASLGVPLLVHLLLAPWVALLIGLLGGSAVSLVVVGRVVGPGAWLGLPWADMVPATLAVLGRVLAGLPLALLWLAPLILLVVLTTAWFRRWAWVVLGVGLGLGSLLVQRVFGQPLLIEMLKQQFEQAARALVSTGRGVVVEGPEQSFEALRQIPGWALGDLGEALHALGSPLLLGGLVFAAGCFALLVRWRQRGGGSGA